MLEEMTGLSLPLLDCSLWLAFWEFIDTKIWPPISNMQLKFEE